MLRRPVDATVGVLGLVSLGPLFFGLLCGIAVDRVQAAHERAAVLEPYKESLQARNRQLMAIELQTHGRHEAFQREWRQRLDRIGEAVTLGDTRTAMAVWREGYAAAMQKGQWRDLIDIGDAALRIGDIADFAETAPGAARRSYLTALHRAQSQARSTASSRSPRASPDWATPRRCRTVSTSRGKSPTATRRRRAVSSASPSGSPRPRAADDFGGVAGIRVAGSVTGRSAS